MANNYVPSTWDYIGQGLTSAAGGIKDIRAEKERKKQEEYQRNMQMLQMLMQGYSSGAVGNDAVNVQAAKMGLPADYKPNQRQMQDMIVANPQGKFNPAGVQMPQANIPQAMPGTDVMQGLLRAEGSPPTALATGGLPSQGIGDVAQSPLASGMFKMPTADLTQQPRKMPWSDNELRMAGLPTELEQLKTKLDTGKHQAGIDFLGGGAISDQASELLGVKTPAERALAKAKDSVPVVSEAASRYVAEVIPTLPGSKLSPKNLNLAINLALDKSNQYRKESNLGQLSGADLSEMRSHIAKAVYAAWGDEQKLDDDRRQTASMFQRATANPQTMIENVVKNLDDKKADLIKQFPMLAYATPEMLGKNPALAYGKQQMDAINRQYGVLRDAQVNYGGKLDMLPPDKKQILTGVVTDALGVEAKPPVADKAPMVLSQIFTALSDLPKGQALAQINAGVKAGTMNDKDAASLKNSLKIDP